MSRSKKKTKIPDFSNMKLSHFAVFITQELELRTRLLRPGLKFHHDYISVTASFLLGQNYVNLSVIDLFRDPSTKVHCRFIRNHTKEYNNVSYNLRHALSLTVEPTRESARKVVTELMNLLVPEMHRSALEMLALSVQEDEKGS